MTFILGLLIQILILQFQKKINNNPGKTPFVANLFFLLLSRPFFVLGFVLMLTPIILQNPALKPIARILTIDYWVFASRLVFGVFLSNTIFMQYFIFNLERGLWLQKFDAMLLSLSFLVLSFIFSFLSYLLIDGPCSLLVSQYIKLDTDIYSDLDSQAETEVSEA